MTTCHQLTNAKGKISNREKEILELVSYGQSSTQIASALFLSCHTVRDHRKSLQKKLEARNVAQMIRRAFELQLLNTTISTL